MASKSKSKNKSINRDLMTPMMQIEGKGAAASSRRDVHKKALMFKGGVEGQSIDIAA